MSSFQVRRGARHDTDAAHWTTLNILPSMLIHSQGPGAVHPLADYQLVVVADSSTAQDSARSSQFGFHAVPIVQEGAPLPPSQALWQQVSHW
jgi:hypothetical protein